MCSKMGNQQKKYNSYYQNKVMHFHNSIIISMYKYVPLFFTIKQVFVDQRPLRMRICQPIKFIQRICVEFAARKLNANFARKVAGDLQMCAHAFANASTRKRKFNAIRTKFHLSPTVYQTDIYNITLQEHGWLVI